MIYPDQFRRNTLKERLYAGEAVYGLFITEFFSPNWGSILDTVHYDFAIFDCEHGAFSLSELRAMLPSFRSSKASAILRIPEVTRSWIQAPLDMGINGFLIPMAESAQQIQNAVDMMKYAPVGRRGLSFARPHTDMYSVIDRDAAVQDANNKSFLAVQIETAKGFANLDEILSVEGIDVVFLGNADLSLSMGLPNDPMSDVLRETMENVLARAKEKGLIGGGNLPSVQIAEHYRRLGMNFISLCTEMELIQSGMAAARS